MTETACFLITKRSDLIDMTKRLFDAMNDGFFGDRNNPLRASLNGTYASGKSLVAEAACLIFDDPVPLEDQVKLYWEKRWSGMRHGKPINIAMFNNFYGAFEEDQLCNGRECGGINFISNDPQSNKKSDIVICVEHLTEDSLRYSPLQSSYFHASKQNLTDLARSEEWLRFVSIRVNNQRLLASTTFREAFNAVCPKKHSAGVLSLAFRFLTDPSATHFPDSFKNRLKNQVLPFYNQGLPANGISP